MTERLDKGKEWFERVYGEGKADGLVEMQEGLAQDLARFGIEFNFGDIYSRPGLTLAQRELLSLAALTMMGGVDAQLQGHTRGRSTSAAPRRRSSRRSSTRCSTRDSRGRSMRSGS